MKFGWGWQAIAAPTSHFFLVLSNHQVKPPPDPHQMPLQRQPFLYELIPALAERGKSAAANITETLGFFKNRASEFFFGTTKTTEALDEARATELNGTEEKKIITNVYARLDYTFGLIGKQIDVQHGIDLGNTIAKADIVVGDKTILSNVPATTLLFLEKQVSIWKDLIENAPTLSNTVDWVPDTQNGKHFWRSRTPKKTTKSEKKPEVLVHFQPTQHQPGKSDLVHRDVVIATVSEVQFSGMMPSAERAALLTRLTELEIAIVAARQRANASTVPEFGISKPLFDYIFETT